MKLSDIEKIKKVLDFTKKPVTDFAKELGVHRQTINHILAGRNGISRRLAVKIHEKYNIRYEWIVYGEGNMIDTPEKKSDRIAKIITKLGLTVDQFCDKSGILNKEEFILMINTSSDPPSDWIVRILNTFKSINSVWLITGEGEIFRPIPPEEDTSKEKDEIIKLYRDKVKALEEKISLLQDELRECKKK